MRWINFQWRHLIYWRHFIVRWYVIYWRYVIDGWHVFYRRYLIHWWHFLYRWFRRYLLDRRQLIEWRLILQRPQLQRPKLQRSHLKCPDLQRPHHSSKRGHARSVGHHVFSFAGNRFGHDYSEPHRR
jgi:hypothetical protein